MVPNALDVDKVKGGGESTELVTRYDLAGKTVIGFAGWFDQWDRLDFLVEVFGALRAAHPDLRLLLIGDGPIVVDIKRLVADRGVTGDVIFTGPVPRDRIYDHLSLIDIAVLPHSNDFGSPVVMFEFMGLNVPVVAPRLSPIEDVHRDGETALLFAPLDARMCGRAIESLITSPTLRLELARRARAKLETDRYLAAQRRDHPGVGRAGLRLMKPGRGTDPDERGERPQAHAGKPAAPRLLTRGTRQNNRIAVTFDDGPHPENTPRILDLLDEVKATATFFLQANEAEAHPHLVRQISARGHQIGNHGYLHLDAKKSGLRVYVENTHRAQGILDDIMGRRLDRDIPAAVREHHRAVVRPARVERIPVRPVVRG